MLDWVCDKVEEVDRRDPPRHERALRRRTSGAGRRAASSVTVHDDGTASNEDRLGAIGDIAFVLERTGIDDDLLVIAGDNLFDFALAGLRRVLGDEGARRARSRSTTAATSSSRRTTASSRSDEDDRHRRVRGEAVRAGAARWSRPRPTSTTASTSRSSRATSTRGTRRTSPGGWSRGSIPREPVYGYRVRRRVVRHREPRAAARGGQPLARALGLPQRDEYSTLS